MHISPLTFGRLLSIVDISWLLPWVQMPILIVGGSVLHTNTIKVNSYTPQWK